MKIFKEIVIGKFVLRFYPSDTGWMCGISNEMMDGLEQQPNEENAGAAATLDEMRRRYGDHFAKALGRK